MKPKRWQDWVNVVLGVWLVASPWVLGFADQLAAARAAWVLGGAVVLFAGIGAYMHEAWEEGINVLIGVALMGAPWVLEFANQQTATMNMALSGVLVIVFAISAMVRKLDLKKLKDAQRPSPGTP